MDPGGEEGPPSGVTPGEVGDGVADAPGTEPVPLGLGDGEPVLPVSPGVGVIDPSGAGEPVPWLDDGEGDPPEVGVAVLVGEEFVGVGEGVGDVPADEGRGDDVLVDGVGEPVAGVGVAVPDGGVGVGDGEGTTRMMIGGGDESVGVGEGVGDALVGGRGAEALGDGDPLADGDGDVLATDGRGDDGDGTDVVGEGDALDDGDALELGDDDALGETEATVLGEGDPLVDGVGELNVSGTDDDGAGVEVPPPLGLDEGEGRDIGASQTGLGSVGSGTGTRLAQRITCWTALSRPSSTLQPLSRMSLPAGQFIPG